MNNLNLKFLKLPTVKMTVFFDLCVSTVKGFESG